ncbi:TIR domain-containing protein [Mycoplasma mycoides]|uniref:TIR domain-containing protein n=1 Tax=Mycoplasma mycoides TaxID=2102 RepID=UPI00223E9D58|nr:TIR domain-containing protein [Mycoplasma mycoides]QVJ95581.1 TIR domain-containing protein [Mycoplasma mycoides subsp. capri]
MARKVFFSFHFENDVWRANQVRNSWVTQGTQAAGYIDAAEFEKIKRSGEQAVKKWIDEQLFGTSVTVVLIGSETLDRPYVRYEIEESIKRGNAIIGIAIGDLLDQYKRTSFSKISSYGINGKSFLNILDGFYNYKKDNGYSNMGIWIENAARSKGK